MVGIIEAIIPCHSLSLDLDLSVISTKVVEDRISTSLNQMYAKSKKAAEAFTILPMGLTYISWDKEAGGYVTKTFNIPVAPSVVGDDQVSNELVSQVSPDG